MKKESNVGRPLESVKALEDMSVPSQGLSQPLSPQEDEPTIPIFGHDEDGIWTVMDVIYL